VWVTATSLLNGGLDKWAILIIGLAMVVSIARMMLLSYWSVITRVMFVACYIGLALLTLMSPFWFIAPYL